jgi:aspartate aminotransferase-like enzyme
LCLDAISSLGTLPINLDGVYLASSVSGKALAAYPGVSIVFAGQAWTQPKGSLPRYLDLGLYLRNESVPFTQSSNLLFALQAALERQTPQRWARIAQAGALLRSALQREGFTILAQSAHGAPAVITLALPAELSARAVGTELERRGIFIAHASDYLIARNWVQLCLFGEFTDQALYDAVSALAEIAPVRRQALTA